MRYDIAEHERNCMNVDSGLATVYKECWEHHQARLTKVPTSKELEMYTRGC